MPKTVVLIIWSSKTLQESMLLLIIMKMMMKTKSCPPWTTAVYTSTHCWMRESYGLSMMAGSTWTTQSTWRNLSRRQACESLSRVTLTKSTVSGSWQRTKSRQSSGSRNPRRKTSSSRRSSRPDRSEKRSTTWTMISVVSTLTTPRSIPS